MQIVLNCCQYGVLYLGSYYNTGPYVLFPHFGNSNLGKLPHVFKEVVLRGHYNPLLPSVVLVTVRGKDLGSRP